jgi:hypothetical protein
MAKGPLTTDLAARLDRNEEANRLMFECLDHEINALRCRIESIAATVPGHETFDALSDRITDLKLRIEDLEIGRRAA